MNLSEFISRGLHYLLLCLVLMGLMAVMAAEYDVVNRKLAYMEWVHGTFEENAALATEAVALEVPRIYD